MSIAGHNANTVRIGEETSYTGDALTVGRNDIDRLFPYQSGILLKDVFVATPGTSLRFGPVLDVVGMRCGLDGTAFPGICGAARSEEKREIHVIDRAAVTIVANLPGIQEGLIDMAAAPYTPFADIFHLVCVADVAPVENREQADDALRLFQCRLAEFIAAHSTHVVPEREETLLWPPPPVPALPPVGAVYLVQSQGVNRRTYYEGRVMDNFSPREAAPLDLLAGAVVSGNYVLCCNKTCTYIHQEQPIVREMFKAHGNTLDFRGVILAVEASSAGEKEVCAARIAGMAVSLGWKGAILNQEGGGNADTDIMLTCRELEKAGIATVLLVNEFAGADGGTPSLADTVDEAAWMVSAGNNDFLLPLGAVKNAKGFLDALLGPAPHQAAVVPLTRIYASTNQLGFNALSCETR